MSQFTRVTHRLRQTKDELDDAARWANNRVVCAGCPHCLNPRDTFNTKCALYNITAASVRESILTCQYKGRLTDNHIASHGVYNPKTGKHKIVHNAEKYRVKEARKTRRKMLMKRFLFIVTAFIDSFRVNDFYPLKAALRGESYELKKKVSEGSGGSSSSPSSQREKDRPEG